MNASDLAEMLDSLPKGWRPKSDRVVMAYYQDPLTFAWVNGVDHVFESEIETDAAELILTGWLVNRMYERGAIITSYNKGVRLYAGIRGKQQWFDGLTLLATLAAAAKAIGEIE